MESDTDKTMDYYIKQTNKQDTTKTMSKNLQGLCTRFLLRYFLFLVRSILPTYFSMILLTENKYYDLSVPVCQPWGMSVWYP